MPACRAIINQALRKLGVLASGREARPTDAEDALAALRGLYSAWIAAGAFGRLDDVIPIGDYVARGNERIFRQDESMMTVTLPSLVAERWRWDCCVQQLYRDDLQDAFGNTFEFDDGSDIVLSEVRSTPSGTTTPRDASVVMIVDAFAGVNATFLYDGHTKLWQGIDGLKIDDQAPRSAADPGGLAAALAVELQDQFASDISPVTIAQAQRYSQAMTTRYSMPAVETQGVWF